MAFQKGNQIGKNTQFQKGHTINLGKKRSDLVGKPTWNKGLKGYMAGEKNYFYGKRFTDESHKNWKGDDVGYGALHAYIRRRLGKAKECVYCGETDKRIGWASISHKAKRDLNDYISLCGNCHYEYDNLGQKRWAGHI